MYPTGSSGGGGKRGYGVKSDYGLPGFREVYGADDGDEDKSFCGEGKNKSGKKSTRRSKININKTITPPAKHLGDLRARELHAGSTALEKNASKISSAGNVSDGTANYARENIGLLTTIDKVQCFGNANTYETIPNVPSSAHSQHKYNYTRYNADKANIHSVSRSEDYNIGNANYIAKCLLSASLLNNTRKKENVNKMSSNAYTSAKEVPLTYMKEEKSKYSKVTTKYETNNSSDNMSFVPNAEHSKNIISDPIHGFPVSNPGITYAHNWDTGNESEVLAGFTNTYAHKGTSEEDNQRAVRLVDLCNPEFLPPNIITYTDKSVIGVDGVRNAGFTNENNTQFSNVSNFQDNSKDQSIGYHTEGSSTQKLLCNPEFLPPNIITYTDKSVIGVGGVRNAGFTNENNTQFSNVSNFQDSSKDQSIGYHTEGSSTQKLLCNPEFLPPNIITYTDKSVIGVGGVSNAGFTNENNTQFSNVSNFQDSSKDQSIGYHTEGSSTQKVNYRYEEVQETPINHYSSQVPANSENDRTFSGHNYYSGENSGNFYGSTHQDQQHLAAFTANTYNTARYEESFGERCKWGSELGHGGSNVNREQNDNGKKEQFKVEPTKNSNKRGKGGRKFGTGRNECRQIITCVQNTGFDNYVLRTERAYKANEGYKLSRLLCLRDSHVYEVMKVDYDYARIIESKCKTTQLIQLMINHVGCMKALMVRNLTVAFSKQVEFIIHLLNILYSPKHRDENWTLPLLESAAFDLRTVCQRAASTTNHITNNNLMELAAEALLCCFRICSAENSCKRPGMLAISNELIILFFEMKRFDFRQPLMINPYQSTFSYLYNKCTNQNSFFLKLAFADDYLSYAYQHCPEEYENLKSLILIRLEPLKIAKGFIPSRRILEPHSLTIFCDLSSAIQAGDIIQFNRIVAEYTPFFSLHGIFEYINTQLRFAAEQNSVFRLYPAGNYVEFAVYHAAVQIQGPENVNRGPFCNFYTYYTHGSVRQYHMYGCDPNLCLMQPINN